MGGLWSLGIALWASPILFAIALIVTLVMLGLCSVAPRIFASIGWSRLIRGYFAMLLAVVVFVVATVSNALEILGGILIGIPALLFAAAVIITPVVFILQAIGLLSTWSVVPLAVSLGCAVMLAYEIWTAPWGTNAYARWIGGLSEVVPVFSIGVLVFCLGAQVPLLRIERGRDST